MASIKTAISVEEKLLKEVSRRSKRMGVSRSRFFAIAARDYLNRFDRQALIEQINKAQESGSDQADRRHLKSLRRNFAKILEDESW
ncbi:MAG: ribbon-helix-helix protein, CopG family [Tepidisphaeraceae bacterium]|jgi:metal-responsive CopG/Arc/MetJ family transcriptional regulator